MPLHSLQLRFGFGCYAIFENHHRHRHRPRRRRRFHSNSERLSPRHGARSAGIQRVYTAERKPQRRQSRLIAAPRQPQQARVFVDASQFRYPVFVTRGNVRRPGVTYQQPRCIGMNARFVVEGFTYLARSNPLGFSAAPLCLDLLRIEGSKRGNYREREIVDPVIVLGEIVD